jgi:hypothetical protein
MPPRQVQKRDPEASDEDETEEEEEEEQDPLTSLEMPGKTKRTITSQHATQRMTTT